MYFIELSLLDRSLRQRLQITKGRFDGVATLPFDLVDASEDDGEEVGWKRADELDEVLEVEVWNTGGGGHCSKVLEI